MARTAEFVNYQDGAVVSREIVRKSTGSVTLFAFDEGQGLSEHTAPFDALVQVLEGEAEIMVSGQSHRVQGGEMILLPAGQPHALRHGDKTSWTAHHQEIADTFGLQRVKAFPSRTEAHFNASP